MTRTVASVLPALLLAACGHLTGTQITAQQGPAVSIRATDQELMSEAIDKAFEQLKVPVFATADRKALTGFVEVRTASEVPSHVLNYVGARATAAAGAAGIGIWDLRRTLDRNKDGVWSLLLEEVPETDVRVLALVSFAGVDEVTEWIPNRSSDTRTTVLKGRFKAAFVVVPRNTPVAPFSQTITGESRFELGDGKYVDER